MQSSLKSIFILLSVWIHLLSAKPDSLQKYIMIDQFGYHNNDPKIAVIVDPQIGFNAEDSFEPGLIYEVRKWDSDQIVFTDTILQWNKGAVDFTSGDRGWWFDFSKVREDGDYYIFDNEKKVGSYKFKIAADIYKDILKAALRVFYYQRLNDPKEKPYAEDPWTDAAAFMGSGQDSEARYQFDKDNPDLAKDLSGGWMDAGDYNKYVTFARSPIHMLLTAYEQNPECFTDDFNIPESGNGIPDLLDEVKYELEWIKKMQQDDGSVFIKLGNIDYNVATPPSKDKRPRFYGPKCSSAAIATAGMFAHAAIVFRQFEGLKEYAEDLHKRALKSYQWYINNTKSEDCDNGEIKSGDADVPILSQDEMEVVSAIYLYALTGEEKYNQIVKKHFFITAPFYDTYRYLYLGHIGDALFYYTRLENADPDTKNQIRLHRQRQGEGLDVYQFEPRDDLYMAYLPKPLYNWGSNNTRAALGAANHDFITYHLSEDTSKYLKRALGILHYFHGVNPMGIVYMSNMYQLGGDYCADEIWHDWFRNDSPFDKTPPPGYVTGGPNSRYDGSLIELYKQPPQKCYKNWNNGVPENAWAITEPAIYYQASYIKLLAHFIGSDQ
ncbi:MAG: glycoside hydrolase family 9 protein [Calditrichaceae bacterium]|nr:glycoside hydrolase family 9 protein [Calditrichaceae bacterium]